MFHKSLNGNTLFKKISHGGQGRVVVWGVLGWLCLFNVSAWGQFSGGSGDPNDPYLISSAVDMEVLSSDPNHWGDHFRLTADLDLTGRVMTPIGTTSTPFSGTFDGNGNALANLTINLPGTDFVGFFGIVDNLVDLNTIFDLGLIDPNIIADDFVGGLVGSLENGTLSGCYADGGSVSGKENVGMLVGDLFNGRVSNSYATGSVSAFG